jgi:hypothetical protein
MDSGPFNQASIGPCTITSYCWTDFSNSRFPFLPIYNGIGEQKKTTLTAYSHKDWPRSSVLAVRCKKTGELWKFTVI